MELTIKNKSHKIDFFNNVTVSLRFDSIASAFGFSFYFNPDNRIHRELMSPGKYYECVITDSGETLITGTLLSNGFNLSSVNQLVEIGGYSTTGVLEDCQIPTTIYPLQSDGLTLRQIATKLIKPFGIKMVVDSEVNSAMDKVIDKTTASESQSIKDYLSSLASQKNIVLTHTSKGELWFTKTKTNQLSILDIEPGTMSAVSLSLNINGQAMHSTITVMKQADSDGGNAGQSIITNPYVDGYRPKTLTQNSGDDNDTSQAAKTALAEELKNIVLTVELDRWVINGKIIKPNNIITVTAPELYLFNKTKFFIESVELRGSEKQPTASLTCVLPEVYSGETPKNIFV